MKVAAIQVVSGELGTFLKGLEKRLGKLERRGRIETIKTTALKSPEELRKLAVTRNSVINHQSNYDNLPNSGL